MKKSDQSLKNIKHKAKLKALRIKKLEQKLKENILKRKKNKKK